VKSSFIFLSLLALLLPLFADDALSQRLAKLGEIPSQINVSTILEDNQTSQILQQAGMAGLGAAGLPSGLPIPEGAQFASNISQQIPSIAQPPKIEISPAHLRDLAIIAILLIYVFAAGRIADFLKSSGKKITRREALAAPFAYLLAACFGVLAYFASGAWAPPQHTIITMAAYLLAVPLGIGIGLGALALHAFFRSRLTPLQSLDLSMRILLAPIFDGAAGYWASLGAAAILVFISGFTYWSSGGNFSLATLDFLLLSVAVSLYFLYKAAVSQGNEAKAANVVMLLVVVAPSVLRLFFKDVVCAGLALLPFAFFKQCPLLQVGNEVTLALSVLATLVILVPIIPIIYAFIVNFMRFFSLLEVLFERLPQEERQEKRD
jgi:hypothetical protein